MDFLSSVFNSASKSDDDQFDFMKQDGKEEEGTPNFLNQNLDGNSKNGSLMLPPMDPSQSSHQNAQVSQSQNSFLNGLFAQPDSSRQQQRDFSDFEQKSDNLLDQMKSVQDLFIKPQPQGNQNYKNMDFFKNQTEESSNKNRPKPYPGKLNEIAEEKENDDNHNFEKAFVLSGKKGESKKRLVVDPHRSEISAKDNALTIDERKVLREEPIIKVPHEIKPVQVSELKKEPRKSNKEQTSISLSRYNKNFVEVKKMYEEKKEKMKIIDTLMERYEVLYNATEDFKYNFPLLLEKFLGDYLKVVDEMNGIIKLEDKETDSLIQECDTMLDRLYQKLECI